MLSELLVKLNWLLLNKMCYVKYTVVAIVVVDVVIILVVCDDINVYSE